MWAGVVDRGFLGRAAEGSAAVFLGELRREVYVGLRRNYQVGRQLVNPTATIRLALEDIRRFDSDGDELSAVRTREAVGFLGVERPLARGWELAGGAAGRIWDEAGQEDQSTVGLVARVTAATPGRGRLLLAEVEWTGIYQRLALEASGWTRFGSVRAIPRAEMGGKNAIIIDADADLDEAVPGVLASGFGYQGQKCSACSRVIVVEGIYEAFIARLAEAARSVRIGMPEDPGTMVGPVVDADARDRILRSLEAGRGEGRVLVQLDHRAILEVPVDRADALARANTLQQDFVFEQRALQLVTQTEHGLPHVLSDAGCELSRPTRTSSG
jgi:hypothetical protein